MRLSTALFVYIYIAHGHAWRAPSSCLVSADVQQFGQAVAAGKPFQTRSGRSRAKAEDDEEAKEEQTEEESEAEVPTKVSAPHAAPERCRS